MQEIHIEPDTLRQMYHGDNKTMDEIAFEFGCSKTTISAKVRQYGIKVKSRKIDIPQKILKVRYVENSESAQSIAKDYKCSEGFVYHKLKEHNLPVRGRRISIPISRNELEDMYVRQKMTARKISNKTKIPLHLIQSNLTMYNIPLRPDNATKRVNKIPKKDLEDMYARQGCHVDTIGKKFGVSKYTVYRQLKEYGIPRHHSGTRQRTMIPKETLKHMHVNEQKSAAQIARELNCNEVTIWKKLKNYGIEVRGRNLGKILTKDKLEQLYGRQNTSTKRLGEMFNCHPATIHTYLRKFGIPIHRDYSSPEYEEKRRLRKLGLDRFAELKHMYGDKCQVCGRTERLSIHHMWYLQGDIVVKNYTTGNKHEYYITLYTIVKSELDRFRLLCNSCHRIVGLFQSMQPESRKRMLTEIRIQNHLRSKYPIKHNELVKPEE